MRALVGEFNALVAGVDYGHIPLFGDLDALLVGIFHESPEQYAVAGGASVIKAVAAAFLLHVMDIQERIPA